LSTTPRTGVRGSVSTMPKTSSRDLSQKSGVPGACLRDFMQLGFPDNFHVNGAFSLTSKLPQSTELVLAVLITSAGSA
jgi:hypothetical protein